MRVLYFAPQPICPVNTGARLRNYQLATRLAARSSVTFVGMCFTDEEPGTSFDDSRFASTMTLNKERGYAPSKILRGLIGPTPMTVLNYWSERSASELKVLLRSCQFDTVQVEGVQLMAYLPVIQEALGHPSIILDWHNIESELMLRYAQTSGNWLKRIAAKRSATLIERAENRVLDICRTHLVASERERQKLLARSPDANIHIVPNGVDNAYYYPKEVDTNFQRTEHGNSRETILFVGSMDYHANIDAVTWFVRTAWPEIARRHPHLHFTIVGRDPTPEVRALVSDRIHVTGTVDDVRPFYASAVAVIVPLRLGSGTRLKILETMAAEVAVVSTSLGAEGIDVQHDVHLLLADSAQEIAAAVGRVVSSTETRTRLSTAARFLAEKYDWSIVSERLYRIHCDLAQQRKKACPGEASSREQY